MINSELSKSKKVRNIFTLNLIQELNIDLDFFTFQGVSFIMLKTEATNPKLIFIRKKIINNIQNKLDYHKSMSDMYQERAFNEEDVDVSRKARINAWRHNKEVSKLENELSKQVKILNRLSESTNLIHEFKRPENTTMSFYNQSKMTFSSMFKPINISSLNVKSREMLMLESKAKLNKITALMGELKTKSMNPQNKNAQRDQLQLKYCNSTYKLHHEFINKVLFWKSRSNIVMGPQFLQLREQYTRALFNLEQDYKREELGLDSVDTSNY